MFVVGASGYASPEMVVAGGSQEIAGWLVITLNFGLVDALLTLAIGAILGTLQQALQQEVSAGLSLEREGQLLRTLVDTLPDVIFTKDTAGRFVNCNPAALEQLGVTRLDQVAGKTVFDLFPQHLAQSHNAEDMAVLSGRPLRNRETGDWTRLDACCGS